MGRRQVRLGNQLNELAAALERLEGGQFDPPAAAMAGLIRRFLIPRLTDPPPPLVVAVVGSTGAGKSTLVNSLAGSPVSKPGVVRPTTHQSLVWTSAAHAERWWPGPVVVGDHPLAEAVALIDTPDLDSNVAGHRRQAIEAMAASDAVMFVTTSSRYGDASPWEVLRSAAGKPIVVVVNRLQTRASGARNDLAARLRSEGMGSIPVLTISEQRIDPGRGRLSPQSVQRLAAILREWSGETGALRSAALDAVADELAAGLRILTARLEDRARRATRAAKEVRAAYETAWRLVEASVGARIPPGPFGRRWFRRDRAAGVAGRVVDAVDRAALLAASSLEEEGFEIPPAMRRAAHSTVSELSRRLAPPTASSRHPVPSEVRRILDEDRQRFLDLLEGPAEDVLERLHIGLDLVDDLDWRSV